MRYLILLICLINFCSAETLRVYNWPHYTPNSVLKQFTEETGIHVQLSTYENDEVMWVKIKSLKGAGYDVVFPSHDYVERMIASGYLEPLNKKRIPNFTLLNPELLNKNFDPNNRYSIPYMWGTTGLSYNKKYINPKHLSSWNDLWRSEYKNKLLMLDDVGENFAMALVSMGYSVADRNPEHIKQAYKKLKKLWPNILMFSNDNNITAYVDEDVIVGVNWNGVTYQAQRHNPDIQYVYPTEGASLWIDNMVILKKSKHKAAAYKFVNFLTRPDIAKIITEELGNSTPNLATLKLLPKEMRENPVLYPPKEILAKTHLLHNLGKFVHLYHEYWQKLKLS